MIDVGRHVTRVYAASCSSPMLGKEFHVGKGHLPTPSYLTHPNAILSQRFLAEFTDKMETGARRIQNFADLISSLIIWKTDFEKRVAILLAALDNTRATWAEAPTSETYPEAIAAMADFAAFKKTKKREWIKERQELGTLYSNIQTKSRTYGLQRWEPAVNFGLSDLEREWERFVKEEGVRSRAINARIREYVLPLKSGSMELWMSCLSSASRRIYVNSSPRKLQILRINSNEWNIRSER